MTTITLDLSIDDEKILRSIMESDSTIQTTEQAVLHCIQNYIPFVYLNIGIMEDRIKTADIKQGRVIPDLPTRVSPMMLGDNEYGLFIKGTEGNISDLINRLSKFGL